MLKVHDAFTAAVGILTHGQAPGRQHHAALLSRTVAVTAARAPWTRCPAAPQMSAESAAQAHANVLIYILQSIFNIDC